MPDRETLKEKIRQAISAEHSCRNNLCDLHDKRNYDRCICKSDAEAALTAIEDAGIDLMCQGSAGAKGETVSAPMEPLQSDIIADAIRNVTWKPDKFYVNRDETGRIFVSADGQPIMDFTARVALELGEALVTLAANSQSPIEERSDTERAANAEGTLTHKPLPPSPEEENGDV